jgi:hypothetical protein
MHIQRWRLKHRLMALIGLIGIGMILLCGFASWQAYGNLFRAKRGALQHLAEVALSLVARE